MALAYTLTFAGVPFIPDVARTFRMVQDQPETAGGAEASPLLKQQPLTDLLDEIDRLIPSRFLQDFSPPSHYPSRNLGALAIRMNQAPHAGPEIRPMEWFYPTTASRWSVFRGLATSSMVKEMLRVTGGNTYSTFIMKASPLGAGNPTGTDTQYTLTTSMRMLPPRPIGEGTSGVDGLYLVTLVDERYDWQFQSVSLKPNQTSTWSSLISSLATALGISLSPGSILDAYGVPEPDSQLWTNVENAALLLDAVAFNIGRVVVRALGGTYSLMSVSTSQSTVDTNRTVANSATTVRVAGGDIFYSGTKLPAGNLASGRAGVVPSSVSVTFPKYVQGNDPVPHFLNPRYASPRPSSWFEQSYGSVYEISVPIGSGGSLVSGLVGVSGVSHTLHTTAKALYPTEAAATSDPANASGLTSMALQLAQDYYNGQVAAALDEVYPGTFAWTPEGIHDLVWIFSERAHLASTRVMRSPWNQTIDEFQHGAQALSGYSSVPKGVGGVSVAQTWRDSFSGNISTTLGASMASGDYTATFSAISYFPTQNRWKGIISSGGTDEEIILFEGTSGGTSVGIAQRGIDGSIQQAHSNGAALNQVTPDTTYGVNLVTSEKMLFAFPDIVSSGGIAGVRIIPQVQTVQVLDASGTTLNGIIHCSGQVDIYDATQNSGSQFPGREPCWVVARDSKPIQSGRYYLGQFMGFSPGTNVAPIYAVNEFLYSGAIGSGMLASGSVNSGNIASGIIGQTSLGSGAVNSGNIASGILLRVRDTGVDLAIRSILNVSGALNAVDGTTSGSTDLWVQPASAGDEGIVTTTEQTLGSGRKTFQGDITVLGSTVSGGISRFTSSGTGMNMLKVNVSSGNVVLGPIADSTVLGTSPYGNTVQTLLAGEVQAQANFGATSVAAANYFADTGGGLAAGVTTSIYGLQFALGLMVSGVGTGGILSGNIASGSIGQFHMASGAVASGTIGNNAVNSGSIASGSIGRFHLASGAVNSGHVASGAIVGQAGGGAFNIASGTIGSFDIGSGAIVSGRIASGQIGFGHLANQSVLSGTIGSGQVGFIHLASGALYGMTIPGLQGGRLTLLSGNPAPAVSGQSGSIDLYFAPYKHNQVSMYSGGIWAIKTFSQITFTASGMLSGQVYDYFLFNNNGTLALELSTAWTNIATRADPLFRQDGVLVKSGDTTRRYLGTGYAMTSGVVCDTLDRRNFYNVDNRVAKWLRYRDSTMHTYTTGSWRAWNGASPNTHRVILTQGQSEDTLLVGLSVTMGCAGAGAGGTNNFVGWVNDDPTGAGGANTPAALLQGTASLSGLAWSTLGFRYFHASGVGVHELDIVEIGSEPSATMYNVELDAIIWG